MAFAIATSASDARKAIEQRVSVWWVTDEARDAAFIAWPNAPFTTPTGEVWLQAGIVPGVAVTGTLGTNGLNQVFGVLFLTLYAPKGDGFATLDALASRARAKFGRQIAAGIEYLELNGPRDIGDPAFASAQLEIRFRYYEIVNAGVTL